MTPRTLNVWLISGPTSYSASCFFHFSTSTVWLMLLISYQNCKAAILPRRSQNHPYRINISGEHLPLECSLSTSVYMPLGSCGFATCSFPSCTPEILQTQTVSPDPHMGVFLSKCGSVHSFVLSDRSNN